MAGQKNYFGKGSIRPNFLDPKKTLEDIESTVSPLNSTATTDTDNTTDSASRLRQIENNITPTKSLYTGRGAKRGFNTSKRRGFGFFSRKTSGSSFARKKPFSPMTFLRFSPLIMLGGLIIVVIFLIIGASSFLGADLEALFTESTNTDYTAYNLRSNEVFTEILSGQKEMPEYLKTRLQKEGITTNADNSLSFNDTTITADNYESTYNSNANFREAITHARRGRAATFFDSTANDFYKKLGLSRDVLHDYKTSGDSASDTANYDQIMTEYFDVDSNSTVDTATKETSTDENGKETTSIVSTGAAVSSNAFKESDAKTRAKEYLDAVGNKVESSSTNCATLTTGDMVATAVASNAKYTYANTFMTIMESISKSMAGDSNGSGINTVLNWFTKPETTTIHNPVTGAESQVTGTPLEAQSVRAVLSGVAIDQSKTEDYSLERGFASTNSSIANSGSTCDNNQAGNVALSLNAQGNPGSSFVRTAVGALLDTTIGSGFKIVASSTLGLLVPTVADVLYSNAYTNAQGVSGGEMFGMGAANVNQLAAQQNSGATGASKEQILAFNHANNITIAQEAEVDRNNHSPFDASNSNTFFGKIASTLLPLATTSSTIFSPISTLTSVSSTSLANLNPTYADGENTSYLTNFGTYCQKVESIGAVGNVYCNMIAVNDLSIINIPESDPTYQKVISKSIDYVDGKEVIREGSPLADFITYWTGRYSMPGIYDANIASACEENRTGKIPILSSIASMFSSSTSEYCKSVADGSRYINSASNPNWETEKYHQLYVLNNRVKENLGFYKNKTNPLTAFRENYDAKHPLDNSRSGYLARISGLTKYDAETVIALSDYYQKLADYKPENAYQFTPAHDPVSNLRDASFSDKLPSSSTAISSISLSDSGTMLARPEETTA